VGRVNICTRPGFLNGSWTSNLKTSIARSNVLSRLGKVWPACGQGGGTVVAAILGAPHPIFQVHVYSQEIVCMDIIFGHHAGRALVATCHPFAVGYCCKGVGMTIIIQYYLWCGPLISMNCN